MQIRAIMALLLLLIPMQVHAYPVIDFSERNHAFGTIGQEGKPEHFFEFINRGDQELIIEKVTAT